MTLSFLSDSIADCSVDGALRYLLDQLNGMHWRDVPAVSRDAFSLISLLLCRTYADVESKRLEVYSVLDSALLLGSDFAYDDIQAMLRAMDNRSAPGAEGLPPASPTRLKEEPLPAQLFNMAYGSPSSLGVVGSVECPGLDDFLEEHMIPGSPVVLRGCLEHWPALSGPRAWANLDYIRRGECLHFYILHSA